MMDPHATACKNFGTLLLWNDRRMTRRGPKQATQLAKRPVFPRSTSVQVPLGIEPASTVPLGSSTDRQPLDDHGAPLPEASPLSLPDRGGIRGNREDGRGLNAAESGQRNRT